MKRTHRIAAGIAAALSLGLAAAAFAQPAWNGGAPCPMYGAQAAGYGPGAGGGYGPGWMMRGGGYGPGAGAGMGPGSMGRGGGYGPGAAAGPGFGGRGLASQLMTPEEWAAHREQMANATTPEERQQLAAANHAELVKRAKEKGITVPEFGPRRGFGPGFRRAPQQAPAETQ